MFDAPHPLLVRAVDLIERGDCPGGYRTLLALLREEPGNAVGWFNLGGLHERLKQWEAAVVSMLRSSRLLPNVVATEVALGWYLQLAGRPQEAERVLRRILVRAPEQAVGHTNLGHVLTCLDREVEGLAEHLKAVDLAPTDLFVRLGHAFGLFANGRWREGFAAWEARIEERMPWMLAYPWPRWDGGEVGTLFLQGEQGLGDTVMMLRYLEEVERRQHVGVVGRVILEVQPALVGLCREQWPHWEVRGMPDVMPSGVDAWCALMSLPNVLRELPCPLWEGAYLPGWNRGEWPPRRVGLCWQGDVAHMNDAHRSVALRELLPLMEVEGVEFVSLQYGGTKDIDSCGAHALVRDLSPEITDMRDVARLVGGLDLVISVDTATAHLAGAMGCPTWVLINQWGTEAKWGRRGETTPWYGSWRFFRRGLDEQWSDVVGRVAAELSALTQRQELAA